MKETTESTRLVLERTSQHVVRMDGMCYGYIVHAIEDSIFVRPVHGTEPPSVELAMCSQNMECP